MSNGLDQVICPIKLSSERSCVLYFLSLRTLRTTLTELHSLFASLASRYSAVSAIHANASSISGPEVGTSTKTFLKCKVLQLLSIRGDVLQFFFNSLAASAKIVKQGALH